MRHDTGLYIGEALSRYGFSDHPFGCDRHDAFVDAFNRTGNQSEIDIFQPAVAEQDKIEYFHTHDYVEKVKALSTSGSGYLAHGDTPAFKGIYEAACTVVGTGLTAVQNIIQGLHKRAFIPIAGLHHARRDIAAGFCVFNDCGIVIEALRRDHGIRRIAYVDIDAHHGDGVFYSFEHDPDLIFIDLHEDPRFLYPGTGYANETGKGIANGTKLNLPMRLQANDDDFMLAWKQVETFLEQHKPEFILFQCGADSLKGDPITDMEYSEKSHAHATERLCILANRYCNGRLLAMGGGGYNRNNLARAWCAVVGTMTRFTKNYKS